jgi:biotin transport system substrate-specific component
MTTQSATVGAVQARPLGLKLAVALAGALVVAAAAQVAVPLPGTPVPMTLQPLAVLIVGGLLGPRFGALSLVTYLAMGAAGLPVFTPGGLPGFARLIGPTGGYLVAYPFAAALVGWTVRRTGGQTVSPSLARCALAALLGAAAIHLGGLAQLTILTGDASTAFAAGVLPFVVIDVVKIAVAALVVRRALALTRALP